MTESEGRILNRDIYNAVVRLDAKVDVLMAGVQDNRANIMVLAKTSNGYGAKISLLEERERAGAIERAKYVGLGAIIAIISQMIEQIRALLLR